MEGSSAHSGFFSSIPVSNTWMLFSQSETIEPFFLIKSLALNAQKVFGIRSSEYRIPALTRFEIPIEPDGLRSDTEFFGNRAGDGKTTHKVGKGQGSRNAHKPNNRGKWSTRRPLASTGRWRHLYGYGGQSAIRLDAVRQSHGCQAWLGIDRYPGRLLHLHRHRNLAGSHRRLVRR